MNVHPSLIGLPLVTFLVASVCNPFSGVTDPIDQATAAINNSVSAVQVESSAWRNELPQLQTNLDSIVQNTEGQANADAKKLLVDTSNQVRSLSDDTIKVSGLTAQEWTAKFGAEVRCNTDFARARVSSSLQQMAASLAFWKAHNHQLPPPPPHSVCQVTPDSVELHATGTGGTWSMSMPPDKIVGVFGYDFRPEAMPTVELQTASGDRIRAGRLAGSYVTRYQLNLDFAAEDFAQVVPGARFVLQWPDQPEPNAISTTLVQPASLKILSVTFAPAAPRARADLVYPTVVLSNRGGSDSHDFVLAWKPGPNEPVQSLTVSNLGPGQQTRIVFPGYAYGTDGTFPTDITAGNGSDSYHGVIVVAPYASVAHSQDMPMRGEWPNGGGDPGQTMAFPVLPIILGSDCVIDTSRGGGQFTVDDINNPAIKYLVAWPAGYDFNFGDNTFWRSISSVSASYDTQARRVSASVTLKGLGGHGLFASRGPERFNGTFTVYYKCPQ